jgi:hypothetical protein
MLASCRLNTFSPINGRLKPAGRVALCSHPSLILAAFEVAQVPFLAGKPEKKRLSAVEAADEADGPRKMQHN